MKKIIALAVVATMFLSSLNTYAQTDLRKKQFNLDKAGVALQGYDPVAYLTLNKAVKGKKDLAVAALHF